MPLRPTGPPGQEPHQTQDLGFSTGNDAVRLLEPLYRQGADGRYPSSSPTAAPLIVARFTKSHCRPCPARTRCTSVGFPLQELRDLQLHVRTEQQTPKGKTRYAVRSGAEGTVRGFAQGPRHVVLPLPRAERGSHPARPDGHGVLRCRPGSLCCRVSGERRTSGGFRSIPCSRVATRMAW